MGLKACEGKQGPNRGVSLLSMQVLILSWTLSGMFLVGPLFLIGWEGGKRQIGQNPEKSGDPENIRKIAEKGQKRDTSGQTSPNQEMPCSKSPFYQHLQTSLSGLSIRRESSNRFEDLISWHACALHFVCQRLGWFYQILVTSPKSSAGNTHHALQGYYWKSRDVLCVSVTVALLLKLFPTKFLSATVSFIAHLRWGPQLSPTTVTAIQNEFLCWGFCNCNPIVKSKKRSVDSAFGTHGIEHARKRIRFSEVFVELSCSLIQTPCVSEMSLPFGLALSPLKMS